MTVAARRWHVGRWGRWGWLETAIKAAAFLVAYAALMRGLDGPFGLPDGAARIAVVVLIAAAELGLMAAIGDRLLEREVIAMVFVVANNAAHLAMLGALLLSPGPGALLTWFCALMLAGESVKLVFLRVTGFSVRDVAPSTVQALTAAYAAIYLASIVLWGLA